MRFCRKLPDYSKADQTRFYLMDCCVFYLSSIRFQFPGETAELDSLFKKNNCTLTGTGITDGLMGHIVINLAASASNVR